MPQKRDMLVYWWEYRYLISRGGFYVASEEDERPLTPEEMREENERAEREEEQERETQWEVWLAPQERTAALEQGFGVRKVGKVKRLRVRPEFRDPLRTMAEVKCKLCWREWWERNMQGERRCPHCGKIGGW